jgi:hypothetical protein
VSKPQAELAVGRSAVKLVAADALVPVPADEAGEVALPRAHRAVQPVRGGVQRRRGEELDRADLQAVEVDDAPPAVPHPHAVVEVARLEAVEVEGGPVLQGHPHLAALRLDARDLAEAHHEEPADSLPAADLDPEDGTRAVLLGQQLRRHAGEPGVVALRAVEEVAPERLLIAPPAQAPLVGAAADGGDPAVEEPLLALRRRVALPRRRRGRGGDRGRGRHRGVDVPREEPVAHGEGQAEGKHGGQGRAGDRRSRHGRSALPREDTSLVPPRRPPSPTPGTARDYTARRTRCPIARDGWLRRFARESRPRASRASGQVSGSVAKVTPAASRHQEQKARCFVH